MRTALICSLIYVVHANFAAIKGYMNFLTKFETEATEGIEMQGIAKAVVVYHLDTGKLPQKDFSGFMRTAMRTVSRQATRDTALDMWGTEYRLKVHPEGFEIQSAGPDQAWYTRDDLRLYQEYKHQDDVAKLSGKDLEASTSRMTAAGREAKLAAQRQKNRPKIELNFTWLRGKEDKKPPKRKKRKKKGPKRVIIRRQ
jgi:hypothetical protein